VIVDRPWDLEPVGPHEVEESGLRCVVVRGPMGAWCGYVEVPKGHPFFGLKSGGFMRDENAIDALDVHGGVTYAGRGVDGMKEGTIGEGRWYIGFDASHWGDLIPLLVEQSSAFSDGDYRTLDYMLREARCLARQIVRVVHETERCDRVECRDCGTEEG